MSYRKGTTRPDLDKLFNLERWFSDQKGYAKEADDLADIKNYIARPDNVVSFPDGAPYQPCDDVGDEEEEHDIGWAVEQMCQGLYVGRSKYPGNHLGLQDPDGNSANTLPYFFLVTSEGNRLPWHSSNEDLLALDWELA